MRIARDTLRAREFAIFSKNKDTWCRILESFKTPNTIQAQVRQLADEGQWSRWYFTHYGSVWTRSFGNRNVPYLYENDAKRKLNLNWYDNDWNDNYRFLAVRNFLYSLPFFGRVSFCNCFIQPPSILPISDSGSES